MATFEADKEALDRAVATGDLRILEMLDDQPPPPPAAATPSAAPQQPVQAGSPISPPPAQADSGPGFWSRLGSGLSDLASRVTINTPAAAAPMAIAAPPPPSLPWGWILGLAVGALVLVGLATRSR